MERSGKKFLICKIPPDKNSGVGRLLIDIVPEYKRQGFIVLCKRQQKSSREMLRDGRILGIAHEAARRIIDELAFNCRLLLLRNKEIVLIHPQSIGFGAVFWLARKNRLSLHVMDNSFFCIQSYNCHPTEGQECLHCLGRIQPLPECRPHPHRKSKMKAIRELRKLHKEKATIDYLTQNKNQERLLRAHLGEDIKTNRIGLGIKVLSYSEQNKNRHHRSSQGESFDCVFHGVTSLAKGCRFVIQLAERLPQFTFLIPDHIEAVRSFYQEELPHNLFCKRMTWETGLESAARSARVVLNPSQWSAPIEGALLKSASVNPNVATVQTRYGFEAEFDGIKNHLSLSAEVDEAAKELKTRLEELQMEKTEAL